MFEPYYTEAEAALQRARRARRGPDRAPGQRPLPEAADPPRTAHPELVDDLQREGLHPFHLPMGAWIEEDGDGGTRPHSPCLRCDPFDGYPSLTNGKADAQVICVDPALQAHPNLTLLTGAYVERLLTDAAGPHGHRRGDRDRGIARDSPAADIVVVACGALSSALLLLRSANDAHPHGLANGSGLVGRNYMRHNNATVLAISRTPEPHAVPEDAGAERLLSRPRAEPGQRMGVPARPHPDGRQVRRRADRS